MSGLNALVYASSDGPSQFVCTICLQIFGVGEVLQTRKDKCRICYETCVNCKVHQPGEGQYFRNGQCVVCRPCPPGKEEDRCADHNCGKIRGQDMLGGYHWAKLRCNKCYRALCNKKVRDEKAQKYTNATSQPLSGGSTVSTMQLAMAAAAVHGLGDQTTNLSVDPRVRYTATTSSGGTQDINYPSNMPQHDQIMVYDPSDPGSNPNSHVHPDGDLYRALLRLLSEGVTGAEGVNPIEAISPHDQAAVHNAHGALEESPYMGYQYQANGSYGVSVGAVVVGLSRSQATEPGSAQSADLVMSERARVGPSQVLPPEWTQAQEAPMPGPVQGNRSMLEDEGVRCLGMSNARCNMPALFKRH